MPGVTLPNYNYKKAFGMRRETVYGTVVGAADVWFRAIDIGLACADQPKTMEGPTGYNSRFLYSGASTPPRLRRDFGMSEGRTILEADYDDVGHILANVIDAPATVDNVPETGVYSHIFTMPLDGSSVPNNQSFTAFVATGKFFTGGPPGTTLPHLQYPGAMIDVLEIAFAQNRIVALAIEAVARRPAPVVAGSIALSVAPMMEFEQFGWRFHTTPGTSLSAGHLQTAGAEHIDGVIRIDNNLRKIAQVGADMRELREPVPQGVRTVTMRMTRDFYDNRFYVKRHPGDAAEQNAFASFGLFGQSYYNIPTKGTKFSMNVEIRFGVVDGPPIVFQEGDGITPEIVAVEAATDGSTPPLLLTLINGTGPAASAPYGT